VTVWRRSVPWEGRCLRRNGGGNILPPERNCVALALPQIVRKDGQNNQPSLRPSAPPRDAGHGRAAELCHQPQSYGGWRVNQILAAETVIPIVFGCVFLLIIFGFACMFTTP
jgi:hypothetical protein